MAKHVYRSLPIAALLVTSVAAGCSDQTAPPASQGGAAGSAGAPASTSGAGGSLAGTGGAGGGPAGSAAGGNSSGAGGAGGSAGAGGSSGASSNGGAGGSGGSTPYVPPVSTVICAAPHAGGLDTAIAHFDDGLDVLGVDGRGGIWFGYSDGTGTQTDNPLSVVDSDAGGKALHVTGKGFTMWGSGIGSAIAFDFEKDAQCPYDASAFAGVRLKVKGTGSVRLRLAQVATTPVNATNRKGSCDPNRYQCEGHHEVTIALTDSWTEHAYEWADFQQAFGLTVDFDAKARAAPPLSRAKAR